jgi:putative transcriptional regulator
MDDFVGRLRAIRQPPGSSRCAAPVGRSNAYGYRESHAGAGRQSPRRHQLASDGRADRRRYCPQFAGDPDAAPILTGGETMATIARTVRKRLGLSQAEFAARFHVPVGTLRDWEQNRRQPDAPALAYLRVIAREPEMVARALVAA